MSCARPLGDLVRGGLRGLAREPSRSSAPSQTALTEHVVRALTRCPTQQRHAGAPVPSRCLLGSWRAESRVGSRAHSELLPWPCRAPVSYTHLTLPTSDLV